jgi:FkbM family methyltransferase
MNILHALNKAPAFAPVKAVLKGSALYRVLAHYAQIIGAAEEVRKWSEQDARAAAFYGRLVTPDDLVFDIGANLGNRVKVFRHLGCRVVAVEPQAFCVAVLKRAFPRQITIVDRALSDRIGTAELYIANVHVLSSMSKDWIRRTTEAGRFSGNRWDKTVAVKTTTLDAICREFGEPAFVKIDVEGHEEAVFRGLSVPIQGLSFEFASENLQSTFSCLALLDRIGRYEFNYSLGESMQLELRQWASLSEIQKHLSCVGALGWGDVYAKLDRGSDNARC